MTPQERIEQEIKDRLLDSRSQDRYTRNGDLKSEVLSAHLDGVKDYADQTVPCTEKQPALGLFDAETLERIQRTFPRP